MKKAQTEQANLPQISSNDNRDAVVVFSSILTEQSSRFLVHLLLSLGTYVCEYDLFSVSIIKEAFEKAGFDIAAVDTTVLALTKRYVVEQAQFVPGSTRMFDKNVCRAFKLLTEVLNGREVPYLEPPRVLFKAIREKVSEKVSAMTLPNRQSLATVLFLSNKVPNCPAIELLLGASTQNPLPFEPQMNQTRNQSSKSIEQQLKLLALLIDAVNAHLGASETFVPHIFALGRPGTRKCTASLTALTYGVSKGLNCVITTLSAEKAASLGGTHIHRLMPIPVNDRGSTRRIAERTICKLHKQPIQLAFLKQIDVVLVEDIGMISSELWSVMDYVFRYINHSALPMGGVLVIGNGDPKQLSCPQGTPIWSSPNILINFKFFNLSECSND